MIVVDASVIVDLLLAGPSSDAIRRRLSGNDAEPHAPHLIDAEIAQVLRRFNARGRLSDERARQALGDHADLEIIRYPHDVLLDRVWQLRKNVTAYDALYLALAEALGAPLLTLDRRLATAPGHHAEVEVL